MNSDCAGTRYITTAKRSLCQGYSWPTEMNVSKFCTVDREYFIVKILFWIAWLMRKLNTRKYMRIINGNAVRGRLSENYLTRKFIARNISRFTVFGTKQ